MSDEPNELIDLRKEVSRQRGMVVMLLGAALLFLALLNTSVVFVIPGLERIYEEMLGSKDKLPGLTRFALKYGRAWGSTLPYGLIAGVPALAFILVLVWRRSVVPFLLSTSVMVLLIVHAWILLTALFLPLMEIASGVGEKSH